MNDRLELSIHGMHCEHCEIAVEGALTRAGLGETQVEWRRGRATGLPSGGFSITAAADEIAALGYQLVEADAGGAVGETGHLGEFDLVVVGAGSAAFAAAIRARELGATVALVERGTLGGTCVNVGCVPSKALLRAAESHWRAGHSPFAGVETIAGALDLPALMAQKDEVVTALRKERYEDLLDHHGIELIRGSGRFVDSETLQVDGRPIRAGRFLVATGAAPWAPSIEGLADIDHLTSTSALELTEVPEAMIVVGANAVGLELGQLYLHLGSQITFVEALPRVAPFEEPEISEAITARLTELGAVIHTGATARAAGMAGGRKWLDVETDEGTARLEADQILMATGRRARTDDLGLENTGVDTDERGHIVVDATLGTSDHRIYAAGDVTDHPQFVYVAALGGSIAADNALRGSTREIDFATMPRVTFTTPQIASVGLTEAQAREAGTQVITSVLPLDAVPRAIVDHDTHGLVKLVADEASGRLLGAHMIADGAGDVIQAAVMALEYRATIDEIAETYHPYLTMAEAFKLAAQGFGKDVKMLSCCAA